MSKSSKRKLRKKRVAELSALGLEPGKLYSFKGRFRYLYKEKKADWQRNPVKIRTNDHLMFLKADLWYSDATKRKVVSASSASIVVKQLKENKCKIISRRRHGWRHYKTEIIYKPKEPIYSGMLYVGYGDKFGWINVVQMTKDSIKKQFEKVDLEK